MRLFRAKVPQIADEIVRTLTDAGDVEVVTVDEVRTDLESVLKEFIRREQEVTEEAKDRMERGGLGYAMLGKVKAQVGEERGFPAQDEHLFYLSNQLLTMLFHSQNVDEVFSEDHVLRKKISAIVKKHTSQTGELDREVRAKIKNLEEGTAAFEIEYARVMGQLKSRKGLE